MVTDRQTVQDPVSAGTEALARGAWTEARERFEAALAREESSGAWEGLGWAGWWLADAELTVRAREHAYRAYRAFGDSGGAGRVAAWLAADFHEFRVRTRWPAGGSSGPTGCSTAWRRAPITDGSRCTRARSS